MKRYRYSDRIVFPLFPFLVMRFENKKEMSPCETSIRLISDMLPYLAGKVLLSHHFLFALPRFQLRTNFGLFDLLSIEKEFHIEYVLACIPLLNQGQSLSDPDIVHPKEALF